MPYGLSGQNPSQYLGVRPLRPPNMFVYNRNPISGAVANADYRSFNVGDFWLNDVENTETLWILANKEGNVPLWLLLGGAPSGDVVSLSGNDNVKVYPDSTGNIRIQTENATVQVLGTTNQETMNFGISNLVLGSSLPMLSSGANNVGLGNLPLNSLTSGSRNTAIGYGSLNGITSGSNNSGLGYGTGANYTGAETNNILIGYNVAGTIAESNTIRIGNSSAARTFITGIDGVNLTSANVVTEVSNQLGTAAITAGSGISISTATPNQIIISATGAGDIQTITGNTGGAQSPSAGNFNIKTANATVIFAGTAATETLDFARTSNLCLGSSLPSLTSGNSNVGIGAGAGSTLRSLTSGEANVVIGSNAGTGITTGSYLTGIGYFTFGSTTITGNYNTAIGAGALSMLTTGALNVSLTSGNSGDSITTGSYNINIGPSGTSIVTGSYNTLIRGGSAYISAESSNIAIGNPGVLGESNTLRIGTTGTGNGQQSTCYIAGTYGVTPSGTNQIVIINSSGQLGSQSVSSETGNSIIGAANITVSSASNVTDYFAPYGYNVTSAGNATEAYVKVPIPKAGTISLLYANVYTNTSTNTITITIRHNGANSTLTTTIAATTTAIVSDTTHSFTVAAGDTIDIAISGASSASAYAMNITMNFNG